MADIALSSAVRASLLSLQGTNKLINQTQSRLSTGLKVSSPVDDARAFFEAKALNDRARDLSGKKEGIDQAISSVKVALSAVDAIETIVNQLKGVANSAKSATTATEFSSLNAQYNELVNQINKLAGDASYQGLNLINGTGSQLSVEWSTDSASTLDIGSVDLRGGSAGGLGIYTGVTLSVGSLVTSAIGELDAALATIRSEAQKLGANVALLQTRLDFTSSYVNELESGAGKLILADVSEEGANLVALQTRQQLGISSLAFAGQSEQSVLALFR